MILHPTAMFTCLGITDHGDSTDQSAYSLDLQSFPDKQNQVSQSAQYYLCAISVLKYINTSIFNVLFYVGSSLLLFIKVD